MMLNLVYLSFINIRDRSCNWKPLGTKVVQDSIGKVKLMKANRFIPLWVALLLAGCSGSKEPLNISSDAHDVSESGVEAGESTGPKADDYNAHIEQEGLNRVFFDFDRYSLSDESKAALDAQAKWLLENQSAVIEVQGHCDRHGPVAYNDGLGQRRADAAADYLVKAGVSPDRIQTISHGNRVILVPGEGPEIDQQNRTAITVVRAAQ